MRETPLKQSTPRGRQAFKIRVSKIYQGCGNFVRQPDESEGNNNFLVYV